MGMAMEEMASVMAAAEMGTAMDLQVVLVAMDRHSPSTRLSLQRHASRPLLTPMAVVVVARAIATEMGIQMVVLATEVLQRPPSRSPFQRLVVAMEGQELELVLGAETGMAASATATVVLQP
jgi:hypothetical protein